MTRGSKSVLVTSHVSSVGIGEVIFTNFGIDIFTFGVKEAEIIFEAIEIFYAARDFEKVPD